MRFGTWAVAAVWYSDRRANRHIRRRTIRRFNPQSSGSLEDRQLLSLSVSAIPARMGQAFHRRHRATGFADDMRRELNVPFTTVNGGTERLDVYLPTGVPNASGRPVLIAIHGGGWRRLDKRGYGARIASAFVPRGYVVVAPDYELSAKDRPTWPVNLQDVQSAVRWVRENASVLGIDPNEIAAVGESAGANLAALVGTSSVNGNGQAKTSSSVQAVVAFSTPADLTTLFSESHLAGFAVRRFLGGTPAQVPGEYVAASPTDHVNAGDPPMFLVQGRQDPLIPFTQSVDLANALSEAGVRNRLVLVRGGHDLSFPGHYRNLIRQIIEFLDATWKDE